MHSTARLLIFTPTWIDPETGEDAIAPECEAAIKSQAGVEFDWRVTAENPYPIGDLRNVLHQYQQAREWFLRSSQYSALLTIEHDNVLPDNGAVQRLIETPGDVIYAPYLLRHGSPVLNVLQYINDRNIGQSLSGYRNELARARRDVVRRVSGTGMGCTLFRRAAIEAIPFEGTGPRCVAPDMYFSRSALRHKLLMLGRFDVPVLHLDLAQGRWLHPYRNEGITMKYLALQTANIMVDGNPLHLTAGEEIDLDPALAHDWLRAGYLSPISVPPAPEPIPAKAEIEATVIEPAEKADAPAQAKRPLRKARSA